jgi:hypothetical protein
MLYWLFQKILSHGFRSRKGVLSLGDTENIARSGTASWVLTQEKARQDYLRAKAGFDQTRSWESFEVMMEYLLALHSTNAIIQALMNEHLLNNLLLKEVKERGDLDQAAARRCA